MNIADNMFARHALYRKDYFPSFHGKYEVKKLILINGDKLMGHYIYFL